LLHTHTPPLQELQVHTPCGADLAFGVDGDGVLAFDELACFDEHLPERLQLRRICWMSPEVVHDLHGVLVFAELACG